MADAPSLPMMRSPSQWPGTARSVPSAGRSLMRIMGWVKRGWRPGGVACGGYGRYAEHWPVHDVGHRDPARRGAWLLYGSGSPESVRVHSAVAPFASGPLVDTDTPGRFPVAVPL